jgi:homoserine kinase
VHRFDVPMGLEAVLVVPHEPVRTAQARAALPATVPIADAVFNVARASLLVRGLSVGDWDLISAGLKDSLHQPYRARLYPRSAQLLDRVRQLGALGATISGAGPTVLVWSHYEQTGGLVEALGRETREWARVMRAPFESQGADVRGL